ncbi:hypothetical protein [Pedobacter sp. SYSU D00535]|uniref:hypothetical protein n=1 Tax=Pedobacter sp. SYSU D00535 TaxID=2810308 RepID=UPI001A95F1A0|nr:hypothetical protein [Pedobacter sp. SYSU D00535]
MFILFKRHGKRRNFKKFTSFNELYEEIARGHNEKFPGNNQFYYDCNTSDIEILNRRLSVVECQEYLTACNLEQKIAENVNS